MGLGKDAKQKHGISGFDPRIAVLEEEQEELDNLHQRIKELESQLAEMREAVKKEAESLEKYLKSLGAGSGTSWIRHVVDNLKRALRVGSVLMKAQHEQTWVKVNARVDAQISKLVEYLNAFPELQTIESCQGNSETSAWVCFYYGNYREHPWNDLASFVLDYLGPRLAQEIGDAAQITLRVTEHGHIHGELSVRPGALELTTSTLQQLVTDFNGGYRATEEAVAKDISDRLVGAADEIDSLRLQLAELREKEKAVGLEEMVDKVCGHLPDGWKICLNMENGAAYVSLSNPDGRFPQLPDSTDKSLVEQLNDALCVANGWDISKP